MSRIDPTVKKETGYIAGWVLLLSAVMELVFLLTGHMDYTVPLGNLLGGGAAILNFFLMGWTIQRAVGLEEKAASAKLKLSQMLRMLMLIVICCVGIALNCFQTVAPCSSRVSRWPSVRFLTKRTDRPPPKGRTT